MFQGCVEIFLQLQLVGSDTWTPCGQQHFQKSHMYTEAVRLFRISALRTNTDDEDDSHMVLMPQLWLSLLCVSERVCVCVNGGVLPAVWTVMSQILVLCEQTVWHPPFFSILLQQVSGTSGDARCTVPIGQFCQVVYFPFHMQPRALGCSNRQQLICCTKISVIHLTKITAKTFSSCKIQLCKFHFCCKKSLHYPQGAKTTYVKYVNDKWFC